MVLVSATLLYILVIGRVIYFPYVLFLYLRHRRAWDYIYSEIGEKCFDHCLNFDKASCTTVMYLDAVLNTVCCALVTVTVQNSYPSANCLTPGACNTFATLAISTGGKLTSALDVSGTRIDRP